jgi:hypothetical protein
MAAVHLQSDAGDASVKSKRCVAERGKGRGSMVVAVRVLQLSG